MRHRPAALRRRLLAWYRRNRRDLPWRRGVSPYRTWVSEIMLQQTTVKTAAPRFESFLRRFPDLRSLAAAPQEEVLRSWAGLGYYARARNLREAARRIVARHGGTFPDSYEDVLALPGIGRYTAGAILSIAFGKPYPVLDGNVARVLSRLRGVRENIKAGAVAERLWGLAEGLLDRREPGDWNQAMMELGATVCLPESPDCGACPVSAYCSAFRRGLQDELPVTGLKRRMEDLRWTCLWIEKGGKVLLWKRSSDERFLKDHWGLPEARHLKADAGKRLGVVRHTITHHRIALDIKEASLVGPLPPEARWVPKGRLGELLISSLWLKCLAVL